MHIQGRMGEIVTGWEDYSLVEILSQIQSTRLGRRLELINFMAELEQRYGEVVASEPVYCSMLAELQAVEAAEGDRKLTL